MAGEAVEAGVVGAEEEVKNEAKVVIATFTVANVVLMGLLHLAYRAGVPDDVIAMTGIGFLFVSGLLTIECLLWSIGFHGK